MIFFVAARNLAGNFKKNSVILLLIMVIVTIFFLGNTVLNGINKGLHKTYVENYTGDVVIKAKSDISFGIFGANTPAIGEYYSIPVIKQYNTIMKIIKSSNIASSSVSQVSGVALMDMYGRRYKVPLFGIEGKNYFNFFKGIDIIQGEMITEGVEGVMMTESRITQIEKETGQKIVPGDPVLLTMFGNTGFKIREVPLKGIYRYKSSSTVTDKIILIDVQTLRALNSITLASATNEPPPKEMVPADSIDSLFGSGDISSNDTEVEKDDSFSVDSVINSLSKPLNPPSTNLYGGGWNFILLHINKNLSNKRAISQLNTIFKKQGLDVEAVNWRTAVGLSAILVLLLQIMYNGGFLLLVTAGIIAIVNILIISVFERTGEIGTLRAIGASKNYVKRMIYLENLLLSLAAGILAIATGYLIIAIINNASLKINNNLTASLFGGSNLQISFSPFVAIISMGASLLLGFLSSIFPVMMALKIEPVSALTKRI